ncbi:hypothetical protein NQ318_006212 [Aromia moschata]|uniref:Uncharacterized protein n=1 Tax=Aromia moschata TaxID=1265417 RepID=A0AAV8YFN2_9CUCU|nr:hypothetical protein NQ318_006212 [Aromia moschata]
MARLKTFNKKKYQGNQHSVKKNAPAVPTSPGGATPITSRPTSTSTPNVISPPSASKRKLTIVNENPEPQSDLPSGNIIVQVDILSSLVQKSSKCVDCGSSNSLKVFEDCATRVGLASKLVIQCTKCEMSKSAMTSGVNPNRCHNVTGCNLETGLRLLYEQRVKEAEKVAQASTKEGRIAARNRKRQRDEEEALAEDILSPFTINLEQIAPVVKEKSVPK